MRFAKSNDLHSTTNPSADQENATAVIAKAIADFRQRCDDRGIAVETDIDDCQLTVDKSFVYPIATRLIANAIQAMPNGGELSVTLIDTDYQWELEVADSGANPSKLSQASKTQSCPTDVQKNNHDALPRVIEFPATDDLREVIRLAGQQNASVESFPCPLGGTAWVMVVPKLRANDKDGVRAA